MMSHAWSAFLEFSKTYGLAAGVLAALLYALQRWLTWLVTTRVDRRFELKIESHKHELQRLLEHDKFDLQRRLTAGSLFMQKQHAAAAESYSAITVAHGAVGGLFGAMRFASVDDTCNRNDLVRILNHFDVHEGQQESLLADWDLDPKVGLQAINQYIFDTRLPRAESKLTTARNLMYENAIYFSDSTAETFAAFVSVCLDWILKAHHPPERGAPYKPHSRPELNAALEQVRLALRAELTNPSSGLEAK